MGIVLLNSTQVDDKVSVIGSFISNNIVKKQQYYKKIITPYLPILTNDLSNLSFRSTELEGIILVFFNRHGLLSPSEFRYEVVKTPKTPQNILIEFLSKMPDDLDKNINTFLLYHQALYYSFSTNLFYVFKNQNLILQDY